MTHCTPRMRPSALEIITNIKPRAQKPNRCPAKQVNKALGPRAMLPAGGATFLRMNRGTPSWLTSSPCSSPLWGPSPPQSACQSHRQPGSDEGPRAGGRGWLIQGHVWASVLVSCAHWDPEARSPLSLCLHVRTSPLSQDSGLRTPEDPLWAHVPEFFLRAVSLGYQVQSVSGNRKNLRQWPSELLARGVPRLPAPRGGN